MPRSRRRSRAETARISMGLSQRRARSSACCCSSLTVPAPTLPRPATAMRKGCIIPDAFRGVVSAVEEDFDAPVARLARRHELVEDRLLVADGGDGHQIAGRTHAQQGAAHRRGALHRQLVVHRLMLRVVHRRRMLAGMADNAKLTALLLLQQDDVVQYPEIAVIERGGTVAEEDHRD